MTEVTRVIFHTGKSHETLSAPDAKIYIIKLMAAGAPAGIRSKARVSTIRR